MDSRLKLLPYPKTFHILDVQQPQAVGSCARFSDVSPAYRKPATWRLSPTPSRTTHPCAGCPEAAPRGPRQQDCSPSVVLTCACSPRSQPWGSPASPPGTLSRCSSIWRPCCYGDSRGWRFCCLTAGGSGSQSGSGLCGPCMAHRPGNAQTRLENRVTRLAGVVPPQAQVSCESPRARGGLGWLL